MILDLIKFYFGIFSNVIGLWTRFELLPGLNYFEFLIAITILGLILSAFFGSIKKEINAYDNITRHDRARAVLKDNKITKGGM